jgi:hypothetical protein
MLRFKVGDLAKIVVAMRPENHGKIIQIRAVGPFRPGDVVNVDGHIMMIRWACDYASDERGWTCLDYQLQPLNPRSEPSSLTRTTEEEILA